MVIVEQIELDERMCQQIGTYINGRKQKVLLCCRLRQYDPDCPGSQSIEEKDLLMKFAILGGGVMIKFMRVRTTKVPARNPAFDVLN